MLTFGGMQHREIVLFSGQKILSDKNVTISNWYYVQDAPNSINPDSNTYSINRYCIVKPTYVATHWPYVETTKNTYNWTDTDNWVNTWNALGKGLIVELGACPSWANKTMTTVDSATSNTVGNGTLTFTVPASQPNLSSNYRFFAYSNGNQTVTLSGTVTSYIGTTLTVNVTSFTGSGTFSDWKISLGYSNLAPTNMADFADWVLAIGTRYNGKILNWFVRNEPVFGGSDTAEWKDSAAKYAEMTRIAYQILKYINPANKILGIEISSLSANRITDFTAFCNASASGFDTGPYIGLGTSTPAGLGSGTTGKNWIDIVSVHGYVGNATGDEIQEFEQISRWDDFKSALTTAGIGNLPIWVTEYMYLGSFFTTEYLRMQRNMIISWVVGGVDNFTWFGWGRSASQWKANSSDGVLARAVWNNFMNQLFSSPIVRVTFNVTTNKLNVTQASGNVLTI